MTPRDALLSLLGSRPFVGEKALETWAKSHKPPVPWSEAMTLTAQLCKEGLAVETCATVGGQLALRWSLASGAPAPAPVEEANDVVTSAPALPPPSKPRGRPPKAPVKPSAPPPVVAPSPPPPPVPAAPLALVSPPSPSVLPVALDEGEEDDVEGEEWPSSALLLEELLAWPPAHLTWLAQVQAKHRKLSDDIDELVKLYVHKKREMKTLRNLMQHVADAVIRTPNGEVPPALSTLLAEGIEAAE